MATPIPTLIVVNPRVSSRFMGPLALAIPAGCHTIRIGSHSVALASGENWTDALAGTALDRPLLLTAQAFLPAVTREYLAPCASHPSAKVILLDSPGHYAAMTNSDFNQIDVGVAVSGRNFWVTQNFAHYP